ncbi:hypothetical protein LCGC14_0223670 [marine sediment metagenome]|uniref:Uncharacterized protein n=1 Tax=marine sediment metagenome TaxID=412755 RepID=A0A0F9UGL5_9ZZZZ
MPSEEKLALINDIKRMMSVNTQRRSSYDSLGTHKLLDKLFMRLGLVIIIGLLGYLAIRDSNRNKKC